MSLRRRMITVVIAATAAVALAGPAGAATTFDPDCRHGCTRSQATDGTSNTVFFGLASTPSRSPDGIIAILIGL